MICFCYFSQKKKLFFILGVAHANLFIVQIELGSKKQFLEVLPIFFFRTTGLQ